MYGYAKHLHLKMEEEMAEIHSSWQRDFDVYDRVKALGIDLRTKEATISDPKGRRICSLAFTPSGLVFTSGTGGGSGPVTNDDGDVEDGYQAGRDAGVVKSSRRAARVLHAKHNTGVARSSRRAAAIFSSFSVGSDLRGRDGSAGLPDTVTLSISAGGPASPRSC